MALDFPTNPVNGQIYDNYYYDSTMGTWRAQGSGLALNAFVNPTITGGTISNLTTDLAVTDGGTGASDAAGARTNLGITPANIGAATTSHTHAAGDITSGTLPIGRGGTGVPTGSGLVPIIPTSVTLGSGSSSVSASGQVTFSSASYVQLNGVFSSSFDHYRFIVSWNGKTLNTYLRFTTNGTPNESANYQWSINVFRAVSTNNVYGGTNQTYLNLAYSSDTGETTVSGDISTPFNSRRTLVNWASAGAAFEGRVGTSEHTVATSFDGFRILPGSGTGTYNGFVSVYGYRK